MTTRELTEAARAAVNGTVFEKISAIKKRAFIQHKQATVIDARLAEALASYPTDGTEHLLIVGPSGNGKSRTMKRFLARHEASSNPDLPADCVPVLYIECPPGPDSRGLLCAILEKLGAKYSASSTRPVLYALCLRLLKAVGTKMIIFDEFQHLHHGGAADRTHYFSILKGLGNSLGITLVGCGLTYVMRSLQTDPQMQRRFEPLPLDIWKLDDAYFSLLHSLETTYPFREPSNLIDEETAAFIFDQSEGLMGGTVKFLEKAALIVARSDGDRINLDLLRGMQWEKPSEALRNAQELLGDIEPRQEQEAA